VTTPSPAPEPPADPRLRARAELLWYLRHASALERWPVLPEEWARRVEHRRLVGPEDVTGRSGPRPPAPPR
jgi:hypothetical protein